MIDDSEAHRFPNFDVRVYFDDQDIAYKIHDSDDHKEIATCCNSCVENGEDRPDTRYRLWINPETGMFYCYNCAWSGMLTTLVMKFSNTDLQGAFKILRGDLMDPMDHMNFKLHHEEFDFTEDGDELQHEEIEFPHSYELIDQEHPYLKKRGIPWEAAMRWDWGTCSAGFAKDRLIVPTYMNDKLVWWQARATWEEDDHIPQDEEDLFRKVLNPKGVSAKSVLYNYDSAKHSKRIVLTEGFFDAAKVGDHAVASNGKTLHARQVEWLQKTEAREVVILWDSDAWTDQKYHRKGKYKGKLKRPCSIYQAADLLRIFFKVKLAKMPDKRDPGDYPYHSDTLKQIVENAKSVDYFKDLLNLEDR